MDPAVSRRVWPVGAILLVYSAAFAWAWPYILDDAFITYRYARHVADGLGPFWNVTGPLRPVEGYSSLLHMFLLAGLHALTRLDLEWLGKMLGFVFTAATILSIAWTARRSQLTMMGLWLALSPFLLPPMVLASASGMETGLFVLLAWATPIACLRVLTEPARRGGIETLVVLALLGTLTRPEFAASALGLFAVIAWRKPELRRSLVRAVLLLYVLPGVAVTGWRLATYGDIVPNTFYVKQRVPGWGGGAYVWRFILLCAAPYLIVAIPLIRRLWREQRNLLLIVAVSVGLPCLYFSSVRPTMGWWYRFLIPHLPLLAWLAATAVSIAPAAAVTKRVRRLRLAGVALLAILALAHVPPILNEVPAIHAGQIRLNEVGQRLRPWAASDRTASYYDVGRLPYAAEWTFVDVVGLTTSRKDLRGDCGNATDLLIRSRKSSPPDPADEIVNPCPKLYDVLVDLEFMRDEGVFSVRMRIFARRDLSYRMGLKQALLDEWPAPYVLDAGWWARYSAGVGRWFGKE